MSNKGTKHTATATRVVLKATIEKHEKLHAKLGASHSKPSAADMAELKKLEDQINAQEKWLRENDPEEANSGIHSDHWREGDPANPEGSHSSFGRDGR